jgi:hypothetical protein
MLFHQVRYPVGQRIQLILKTYGKSQMPGRHLNSFSARNPAQTGNARIGRRMLQKTAM